MSLIENLKFNKEIKLTLGECKLRFDAFVMEYTLINILKKTFNFNKILTGKIKKNKINIRILNNMRFPTGLIFVGKFKEGKKVVYLEGYFKFPYFIALFYIFFIILFSIDYVLMGLSILIIFILDLVFSFRQKDKLINKINYIFKE